MVTDASWDAKEEDLVVVGEWMPITFLEFEGDSISLKRELPNSAGLWNTVKREDINGDNQKDLLVGNLGLNSSWTASKDYPLKLIVKDWDQNGSVDPIIAYYKEGKEWVYNSLDELKKQMPLVRKRYNNYESYANDDLGKVFSKEDLRSAQVKMVQTLVSTIYLNHNGVYEPERLAREVQMAPIFTFFVQDFNVDGISDIMAAGNFKGYTPSLGKQDVSFGNILIGDSSGNWQTMEPTKSGFYSNGIIRDIKPIKLGNRQYILIGNNNGPLEIFKIKTPIN